MDGTKDKDKKPVQTEAQKKKMDIEETKKSLPVYPFKEDLIAAIREHQAINKIIKPNICWYDTNLILNLLDSYY